MVHCCVLNVVVALSFINHCKGRVYCEDVNADPWSPTGYSCPLTCGNLAATVQKLRVQSYKRILTLNWGESMHFPVSLPEELRRRVSKRNSLHTLEAFLAAFSTNRTEGASMRRRYYLTQEQRNMLVNAFKDILNNYTDDHYEFSTSTASQLLNRILATQSDSLRGTKNDMSAMVESLRNIVDSYKSNAETNKTIRLKSKMCLSVSVAGCFCKQGYLEKGGQCVLPAYCFDKRTADMNKEYLAMIQID